MMGYNILFTSLPVLVFGLLEQDYTAKDLLKYPKFYQLNKQNYLMSACQRLSWLFTGSHIYDFIFYQFYNYPVCQINQLIINIKN